jgi:hypothetical protein
MNRARVSAALAVGAIALVATGVVVSTSAGGDQPSKPSSVVKWRKLSSVLARVLEAEQRSGHGLAVARSAGLRVQSGRIQVVVETQGARADAERAITRAGAVVVAAHANLVQALVRPGGLAALTRPAAVVLVRAPHSPVTANPLVTP